jgi:2-polyprenyl-3-methyl-5-hydroxy-6-metoxy-1,4-benzoquinol methylase
MQIQSQFGSLKGIYYRSCNFCGNLDFRVFKHLDVGFPKRIYGNHELTYPAIGNTLRLQYLQCTECGLVGINPLTKFSDIDKRSFDGERNIVAWVDVEYTEYEADKLNAIRIIYDQYEFESYRQENRILDVSCGPGVSLSWLRDEKHWNVYGIDPDLHSVRMARTLYGLEIGNGLIVDVDVPDDYFDLIVMDNSLEHTFNPLETLLIAFRKLRKNGGLFIFVPNSEGLSTQYLDANAVSRREYLLGALVLLLAKSSDPNAAEDRLRGPEANCDSKSCKSRFGEYRRQNSRLQGRFGYQSKWRRPGIKWDRDEEIRCGFLQSDGGKVELGPQRFGSVVGASVGGKRINARTVQINGTSDQRTIAPGGTNP